LSDLNRVGVTFSEAFNSGARHVCLLRRSKLNVQNKRCNKDTRITRCFTPYDFFAVAPGATRLSRIFVRERESGERYSEQLFSTHTVIADNCMCAHVCLCVVNLTKYALHLRSSLTLNLYYF